MEKIDQESENCLTQIVQRGDILANRVAGVKFVLVVLSARGMVFDLESLRQKIIMAYPEAAVFFQTTWGQPMGLESPSKVDLVIDFTGPGQRQKWFTAKKLKRLARFAVGRNAGFFRKRVYDRIFDETAAGSHIPSEMLQRERFVQKKVLNLAGVEILQSGETLPDKGKSIALELPGMQRL